MKNHIKFTQTFYKIKNWVLHFTLTSMVNFINIAVNRNFRRPETYYARYLVGLNLLPKIGDNHFEWYANWNKTDRMFNKGEYHNAVKIRKEIMYEIYKKMELQIAIISHQSFLNALADQLVIIGILASILLLKTWGFYRLVSVIFRSQRKT